MRYSLLSEDEIEDEDHILPLVSWKSRDMVSLLRMLLYILLCKWLELHTIQMNIRALLFC